MSRIERYGPWAIVTGASSGIGRQTALELARDGLHLVLVARRQAELDALADEIRGLGAESRVLAMDLTAPDAVLHLDEATRDLDVGLVAHAAGFGLGGPHEAHALDTHLTMLDLNGRCTLELAHRFLPRLQSRGRGGLLLYASVIAYTGVPWAANYAATKAYVMSLGEGLQVEWARHGLDVTIVAPGPTETGFFEVASMSASAASSPQEVARTTVARLGSTGVVLPDWLGWAIRLSMRTAPRWLGVRIMARIMGGMTQGSAEEVAA
jgi:short-subunit dehydrogenase